MSFLESLYLQHKRHVERHPEETLDEPPTLPERVEPEPEPRDLQFPRPLVTGGGPAHWAQGEILRRHLDDSDDLSGWVPDRPTLHSLRRDIASGIREMVSGFIAGCRDYVTGGGR